MLRPKAMSFFARSIVDMMAAAARREHISGDFDDARWPAHLHINVEPRARGTGAAEGLMTRWFEQLRETNSPGCHLQTLRENTRAVRFFERMGFVKMARLHWCTASGTTASDSTSRQWSGAPSPEPQVRVPSGY